MTYFCPDCEGPHPTEASDLSAFIHMLRRHRDPFFDDTIDALITKLEALVESGAIVDG